MSISRYKKSSVVKNSDPDYKKTFKSRFGPSGLIQNTTNVFTRPSDEELLNVQFVTETWGLGKRLYKFSHQYYQDSQYWWLIALFNGIGTEADIEFGQVIKIPIPLDVVLNLYGY